LQSFIKIFNTSIKKVVAENKVSRCVDSFKIFQKHKFHLYKMHYMQKLADYADYDLKMEFCELIEIHNTC